MEKFAERYYLQNREVFASADMAFILAFSTIMLQTNLHNPAIKEDKRMTKEQFLKQNKGISADGELPEDLLCEIYDRIAAGTLSLSATCHYAVRVLCSWPAKHIVCSC
jgi:brefeldin A-inhibited guanine nucleotide-exchange protein